MAMRTLGEARLADLGSFEHTARLELCLQHLWLDGEGHALVVRLDAPNEVAIAPVTSSER
jgi:hypothetical protein